MNNDITLLSDVVLRSPARQSSSGGGRRLHSSVSHNRKLFQANGDHCHRGTWCCTHSPSRRLCTLGARVQISVPYKEAQTESPLANRKALCTSLLDLPTVVSLQRHFLDSVQATDSHLATSEPPNGQNLASPGHGEDTTPRQEPPWVYLGNV